MAKSARAKAADISAALVKRYQTDVVEDDAEAERLAEQALGHIGRLERRAKLELVVEVGDYLVAEFFGGDLELARSLAPTKPKALRHLEAKAPRLDIAPSQLRMAIAMSVQYRALPTAVRDRLSVRQYRALLPLRDEKQKSKLARRAVAEQISGADLSELVRREHGPARTGRKAQGDLERALNAARRALVSSIVEAALEGPKLRALEPELRARFARDARTLRERIERISDALARIKG